MVQDWSFSVVHSFSYTWSERSDQVRERIEAYSFHLGGALLLDVGLTGLSSMSSMSPRVSTVGGGGRVTLIRSELDFSLTSHLYLVNQHGVVHPGVVDLIPHGANDQVISGPGLAAVLQTTEQIGKALRGIYNGAEQYGH